MKKLKLRVSEFNSKVEGAADSLGNSLVNIFHLLALFAIGGAVVWSAIFAFLEMVISILQMF